MSNLDLLIAMMKVANMAIPIVNCLVPHLELMMETNFGHMKELSWVYLMVHFMVPMKALQRVHCLVLHWNILMELHWGQLVVLCCRISQYA